MKKFSFLILTFSFGFLFLQSCKKKEEATPVSTAIVVEPYVAATIDGLKWSSDSLDAYMRNSHTIVITATANNANKRSSILLITQGIELKSYDVSSATVGQGSYNPTVDVEYSTNIVGTGGFKPEGSITLTKVDTAKKLLSGTFTFTAVNVADHAQDKLIKEGKFTDIPYHLYLH